MLLNKSHKISKILIILGFLLFSARSSADYFAYVTDQANEENSKYIHVINTSLNLYVTNIVLLGTPRDLVLTHKADYVFVSAVITEGTGTASYINVISTQSNKNFTYFSIDSRYIRGLTMTSDDSILFVTHEDGITRITQPIFSPEQSSLNLTYKGTSMVLSGDDKYLFVIGSDGSNNDGISVVDVEAMEEVANYSLGTGAGASSIVFNKSNKELFVLNRANKTDGSGNEISGGQLINLKINNYDTPDNIKLVESAVKSFRLDSFPIDMALNAEGTEIYVAFSFLPDNTDNSVGTGNGYISLFNTSDLNGELIYNVNDLSYEGGGSGFQSTGAVHPLAIGFDNSGRLHIVKQIWNEYAGTYVSSLNDVTELRTGFRRIDEVNSVHLGKRSSSQMTGKFIGADCSYCPNGLEDQIQPVIRPSAISPFMLLFTLVFLIPLRLKRNEINNS